MKSSNFIVISRRLENSLIKFGSLKNEINDYLNSSNSNILMLLRNQSNTCKTYQRIIFKDLTKVFRKLVPLDLQKYAYAKSFFLDHDEEMLLLPKNVLNRASFNNIVNLKISRDRKKNFLSKMNEKESEYSIIGNDLKNLKNPRDFLVNYYLIEDKKNFILKNLEKIYSALKLKPELRNLNSALKGLLEFYGKNEIMINLFNLNLKNKNHPLEDVFNFLTRNKNIDNLIKDESPNNNLRNGIVKHFITNSRCLYVFFFDYSVINSSEDLMVIILNFLQINLICDKMFMPKENKLLYQFLLLLSGSVPSKSVKNRGKPLDDAQLLVEYYNSCNCSL